MKCFYKSVCFLFVKLPRNKCNVRKTFEYVRENICINKSIEVINVMYKRGDIYVLRGGLYVLRGGVCQGNNKGDGRDKCEYV